MRALGYDLAMVEEGQPDPEFEAIPDVIDPNRDGYILLQEYIAVLISKEENVKSYEEIENAFLAITASDRPYLSYKGIASLKLHQGHGGLFCSTYMQPYSDIHPLLPIKDALDYIDFRRTLFHIARRNMTLFNALTA